MELNNWICIAATLLAYFSIFVCRCYRKTKSALIVAWCLFGATIAPFLLQDSFNLTIFYVGFTLGLLSYFDFRYNGRLVGCGRDANEVSEYPHQYKLLPIFATKFATELLRIQFPCYSPKLGKASLVAFGVRDDSFFSTPSILM